MDEWERLLDSISLSESGLVNQFMGLGSIFNIILSAVFGLLILIVYLKTNKKENKDKVFIISIPVISILMTMLMRMQGGNAIVFFGIFGVLSIIRFRSSTSQSDISFILFSVIIGVLIGIGNYIIVFLGFIVITIIILIINIIFNITINNCVYVNFKSSLYLEDLKKMVESYFDTNKMKYKLIKINAYKLIDGVRGSDLVYEINYEDNNDLVKKYDSIIDYIIDKDIKMEIFKKK